MLKLGRMEKQIRAPRALPSMLPRLLVMLAFLCMRSVYGSGCDSCQVSSTASVQTAQQGGNTITAVPNRPTFSTIAETVQTGVFEIEYGYEAASGHQNINGLLKLGLARNLELRFANNPFERDAGTTALGDSAVGLKYRFITEKNALPSVSILYTATLPTAGAELGAGALGHAVGVLISKNFDRHHLDFNEIAEWRGRPGADGFDRDCFSALAYSYSLTSRLGVTAEVAGFSRINAATPSTLTILGALTYSISPRLVIDGGFYIAAHGNLPRATFLGGITYSVADLSRSLHLLHH